MGTEEESATFDGEQANKENVGEHGTQENKFSGNKQVYFSLHPPPTPVRALMVSG